MTWIQGEEALSVLKADSTNAFSFVPANFLCFQMLIVSFSKFNPIVGVNYFYVLFALLNLQNDFTRPLKIVQYEN